ncbi:hypothetical protein [Leptospira bourretii]|uniref:hypothetical protein n=1 Tax=Leptospira bourretii TaxID=2484962 RepID=UPI001438434E|nr:hypothetical protein [Leptospira bourretii]
MKDKKKEKNDKDIKDLATNIDFEKEEVQLLNKKKTELRKIQAFLSNDKKNTNPAE